MSGLRNAVQLHDDLPLDLHMENSPVSRVWTLPSQTASQRPLLPLKGQCSLHWVQHCAPMIVSDNSLGRKSDSSKLAKGSSKDAGASSPVDGMNGPYRADPLKASCREAAAASRSENSSPAVKDTRPSIASRISRVRFTVGPLVPALLGPGSFPCGRSRTVHSTSAPHNQSPGLEHGACSCCDTEPGGGEYGGIVANKLVSAVPLVRTRRATAS